LLINNALDFDDLLLWTAILLEENLGVREKYARRYEHILVDEFQDTNLAQYVLLKHLASFHNNLFVVGDVDQSIYRWRGADYRNVLRFEQDFLETQVILLEQNYRSTQRILDVAMAIIDRNPYRTPKRLFTERGAGNKAILCEVEDDRQEAAFVVEEITRLVVQQQARPGDFAIMLRTNALACWKTPFYTRTCLTSWSEHSVSTDAGRLKTSSPTYASLITPTTTIA
jgi:DNA helicase-2/ATP-dependent DNA helicase PcrA